MEPIALQRTQEDLDRQLSFIIRLSDKNSWAYHRKGVFFLLGITAVFLCIFNFTPPNSLIVFKGVFSILMTLVWLVALLYAIWLFTKRYLVNRKIRAIYRASLEEEKQQYLTFDEEKITTTTVDYQSSLNWSYYDAYLEKDTCIFLFHQGATYQVTSYSATEVGAENLERLKQIVRSKLEPLQTSVTFL
jgi:hypothetical protein